MPIQENIDVTGNILGFSIPQQNFAKNITIYGGYDGKEWEYVTEDTIYRVDHISGHTISLGGVRKYSYYRIKIPNNLEKIDIDELQLMHYDLQTDSGRYQKRTTLQHEVKEEGKSTFITVHNRNRLKIERIHLTIDQNFNRPYKIYTIKNQEKVYYGKLGDLYRLQLNRLNIENTEIDFSNDPVSDEWIVIEIMNRDDHPLSIQRVDGIYCIDKLVFEDTGSRPYKISFGNAKADKPSYDMELYKTHLEKEKQDECRLGNLEMNQNRQGHTENSTYEKGSGLDLRWIFNVIIGIIAVVLMIVIAKKLNTHKV